MSKEMNVSERFGSRSVRIDEMMTADYQEGQENAEFRITILDGEREVLTGTVGCFTTSKLMMDENGICTTHRMSSNNQWLVEKNPTKANYDHLGLGEVK